ncbi:MAG: hypothetical protein BGN96_08900 [Bacteroidales bacterium 45-6]|nr:MAG: hypothetical protein BGN96_08900 [Bacteroidales bacterium 45-6]
MCEKRLEVTQDGKFKFQDIAGIIIWLISGIQAVKKHAILSQNNLWQIFCTRDKKQIAKQKY